MTTAKNPMRRSWLDDTDGGWIAHRLQLVMSPAWRHRPKPLARILERLEIEHMRHGGRENGRLCVSYDQFVTEGVSRRAVRPAIDAGQNLGLIAVVQCGELARNVRMPNEYRLTYVPAKDRKAPTDEWASVDEEKAKAIAAGFVNALSGKQSPSAHSCSSPVPIPATDTPSSSAHSYNSPVPLRALPLISGGKAAAGLDATVVHISSERRREANQTSSASALGGTVSSTALLRTPIVARLQKMDTSET